MLIINLQGNDIHRKGAQSLSNALKVKFAGSFFSTLQIFFKVNTTLTSLSLADNSIGKNGGMAFAETLQINITLEHLNLANCDLV